MINTTINARSPEGILRPSGDRAHREFPKLIVLAVKP
jgi:hypothetical protein